MRLLVTFPGRYGDLVWALPTVRAISRRIGAPVDLLIAGEFASIVPLLRLQPYLDRVHADPLWALSPDQREAPRGDIISPYDATIHLGFRGWPEPDVVRHTLLTARHWQNEQAWDEEGARIPALRQELAAAELDLQTPWITLPEAATKKEQALIVAFTEVHFELKVGLTLLLLERFYADYRQRPAIMTVPGSRWTSELSRKIGGPAWDINISVIPTDWLGYAQCAQQSRVVLADCSAAHVLAVAMGVKAVLMEPLEARWNPVFYPLGTDGPQVTLIKGNDGKPTFDARHVADAVEAALNATH